LPLSDKTERDILNKLESFILNTNIAYAVIQALAKADLAREEVAAGVVNIYQANAAVPHLLKVGIRKEIVQADSESTLFREDSPLAVVYIMYTKLVGLSYLWSILAESIYDIREVAQGNTPDSVFTTNSYEVDPIRLPSQEDHLVNMLHLKLAAQTTFNKIKQSDFPAELANILLQIRKKLKKRYPELTMAVVANFVFLRFICLAITSPAKYGLSTEPPSGKNLRFLVLMSKVMQNLGFGVQFEKEKYMTDLNDFIQNNKDTMNVWLDEISTPGDDVRSRNYPVVEISDLVRMNSLKWMYSALQQNRQVLRRELSKKLDDESWAEALEQLRDLGIIGNDASTDSATTTPNTSDHDSKAGNKNDDDDGEDTDADTENL